MRYYHDSLPSADQLVMVQVKQIQEMGAYVKLVRSAPTFISFRLIGRSATISWSTTM